MDVRYRSISATICRLTLRQLMNFPMQYGRLHSGLPYKGPGLSTSKQQNPLLYPLHHNYISFLKTQSWLR
jgi:hypothetical protein